MAMDYKISIEFEGMKSISFLSSENQDMMIKNIKSALKQKPKKITIECVEPTSAKNTPNSS